MRKINLLFIFLLVLTILPFVSSVPPTQTNINSNLGLQIYFHDWSFIKVNQTITLHAHVSNVTDGKTLNNTLFNCTLHIYNQTGSHIVKLNLSKDTDSNVDHEIKILGGNFSTIGEYPYTVFCTDTLGGVRSGNFEVTYNGFELTTPQAVWYVVALAIIFLFIIFLVYIYNKIPDANPRDNYGEIIGISYLKYLRLPLIGLIYWMFLIVNFIVSGVARAYLTDSLVTNVFWAFYTIQMRLTIPIIIVIFGYLIITIFRDKELVRLMKRGLSTK